MTASEKADLAALPAISLARRSMRKSMVSAAGRARRKSPPLEDVLSGVATDDLEELKKTLRDRQVEPAFLARLLAEYKQEVERDHAFAPVAREGRAWTAKRQQLRNRLLKIMNETKALYEKELINAKRPDDLDAQAGYRAAGAMLAAMKDIYDPIVGPSMGHTPKSTRGPKMRPRQRRLRKMLTLLKLADHATFLLQGLFPAKKKK